MIHFLNTLLTLILALFFALFGILAFLLAWSSSIQMIFIDLIHHHFWLWFLLGCGSFFIGLSMILYTLLTHRKTYITTKSGPNQTSLNESIINEYLKSYFEKLFPKQQIPYRFRMKKNVIHIIADLPNLPLEEQKNLLHSMEKELGEIFANYIGLNKDIELTLSFAP